MKRKLTFTFIIWTVLLITYVPVIAIIAYSFGLGGYAGSESEFTFRMFTQLFQSEGMRRAIINTLIIGVVSSILAVLIGTFAAIGINNMRRFSRGGLMGINQIPLTNPAIITSLSVMFFFSPSGFGLIEPGMTRVILAHAVIALPFVVLLVLPRLRSLDKNLLEAAQDLGSRPTNALFSVVIPQLFPAMVGAFLLGFTLSMDDFILAEFNRGASVETVATYVFGNMSRGIPQYFFAFGTIIFVIVMLVVVMINFKLSKASKKVN